MVQKENEERTEVLYDIENAASQVKFIQNANEHMDLFGEKNGPSIIIEFPNIYKNNYIVSKNRGVKIRFITEITKENIHYCKQVREIVTEMRHLEGLIGGIAVTEREYMTTTILKNKQLLTQVFYSNAFEVVRQGQYIFDTFWDKAIPAEQRIKEIEEGIDPIKTKVLENQEEIYNHLMMTIKRSSGRLVCSSIGGMQMVYNNFFDLYKENIEKQKEEEEEGNGIKWLTFIDNDKDSIEIVKTFLNAGIKVRHIKNMPPINFSVDGKSIQATIERMDKGKFMNNLLVSNEPAYVKHFMLFFQELWDNYGVDAKERIRNVEEGLDYDTEVILHSDRTLDLYLDIVGSAQSEIFLILPTPRAFIRQLKAIFLAKQISKERKVKVRILTPINELVEEWIKSLLLNEENDDVRNSKSIRDSFSNKNIEIRYIEKMSQTKATILVVDRKESLVMELTDDAKDTFVKAIGLSTHSNSKASVLSYVAIFGNLWKQSELYQEIKESNEKLKTNEKILNEFINIASHELRNPIQPIIGLSELAKNKTTDNEQKKILDIVIANAKKLKQLSDDILDLSKIESNSLKLFKEKFDMVELLLNIKDEYKTICDECKIPLRVFLTKDDKLTDVITSNNDHSDDFMAYADKTRLNQVMTNLINNAFKFTSEGSITVTVEKKFDKYGRKEFVIKIKDTGIGINDEIFPRLFSKFATMPTKEGTGLGLYISKNIVEAHGGKIWVKNNEDGKGATFSFSIPITTI